MLIDLTTIPVTVSVDECPSILVVRTWAAFGVNGILTRRRKHNPRALKEFVEEVKPGAQLTQGAITCLESRLVLSLNQDQGDCYRCGGRGCYLCAGHEGRDLKILPDPWEVPTGAKDVVTGHTLTWRASIQAFTHPKNKDLWIVTVARDGDVVPLVRLATKSLSVLPFKTEPLPLQRFTRDITTSSTPNAWERLIEDD